ncbi:RNA 2',3'-cyclic phosphodiesterase [Vibrio alginolyticus]
MRLFFALTFNDATKQDFARYQELVRSYGLEGHNTRTQNFHITLAFIGECTEKEKQTLINLLHQLKSECGSLRIHRLGSFRQKRSKLLWLGIEHNHALTQLKEELDTALLTQNFVVESRDFIPHITLFRHVSGGSQVRDIHITPRQISVYSIALMESSYRESKLVYQVLDEIVQ